MDAVFEPEGACLARRTGIKRMEVRKRVRTRETYRSMESAAMIWRRAAMIPSWALIFVDVSWVGEFRLLLPCGCRALRLFEYLGLDCTLWQKDGTTTGDPSGYESKETQDPSLFYTCYATVTFTKFPTHHHHFEMQ
jgi:hypothetical protein